MVQPLKLVDMNAIDGDDGRNLRFDEADISRVCTGAERITMTALRRRGRERSRGSCRDSVV
jgi:hypothetical protein